MRNEIEKVLEANWAELAINKTDDTADQILSLLEEAIGEEWHHNSATWCAGANTRRKDILNKINPEKGKSNE